MIPRYSRPEMSQLWSDQNRFSAWLAVEIAATEVLTERGVVPPEALARINAHERSIWGGRLALMVNHPALYAASRAIPAVARFLLRPLLRVLKPLLN